MTLRMRHSFFTSFLFSPFIPSCSDVPRPISSSMWDGAPHKEVSMKAQLSTKDVLNIEKALSQSGTPEVLVKIENGKIVVLQVSKKKIG